MGLFSKKDDGVLETYKVTYVDGRPDYPDKKALRQIFMKLYSDHFEFAPQKGMTGKWWKVYEIPYNTISKMEYVFVYRQQ